MNMRNYNIKEMKLNGKNLEFDKGYFIIESDGHRKSWEGEIFDIRSSVDFNLDDDECEIKTSTGLELQGSIIITENQITSTGIKISFQGSGPLVRK